MSYAVFVMVPAVVGVATISTVAAPPDGMSPSSQKTLLTLGAKSHYPWPGVTETNVTSSGERSLTSTSGNVEAWLLVTSRAAAI